MLVSFRLRVEGEEPDEAQARAPAGYVGHRGRDPPRLRRPHLLGLFRNSRLHPQPGRDSANFSHLLTTDNFAIP